MSERYAKRARRDAIQYLLDRTAASWTMHRLHPDEGWDCAAEELGHLARIVRDAAPRPPRIPDQARPSHDQQENHHEPADPRRPG